MVGFDSLKHSEFVKSAGDLDQTFEFRHSCNSLILFYFPSSVSHLPLSFRSTHFSFLSSSPLIFFASPSSPSMLFTLILISFCLCSTHLYFPPPPPLPPLSSTCLPDFLEGAQKDSGSLCRTLYLGEKTGKQRWE